MASLIATQNTKTSLEEIEKLWADAPDQKHPLSLFDWVRQSFGLLKT
jgi:predicted 3-demethylubiquinone-9 3-methyltransferase (glyoxalase superfamily)